MSDLRRKDAIEQCRVSPDQLLFSVRHAWKLPARERRWIPALSDVRGYKGCVQFLLPSSRQPPRFRLRTRFSHLRACRPVSERCVRVVPSCCSRSCKRKNLLQSSQRTRGRMTKSTQTDPPAVLKRERQKALRQTPAEFPPHLCRCCDLWPAAHLKERADNPRRHPGLAEHPYSSMMYP